LQSVAVSHLENTMSEDYYYPYRPRTSSGPKALLWILVFVLLGLIGLVLVWRLWPRTDTAPVAKEPPRAVTPRGELDAVEQTNIKIYKQTIASVVHVTNLSVRRNPFSFSAERVPQGTGTGFIWDDKGRVVTNYHVIAGASAARVTLADHTTVPATLVGADPNRDIAVLRVNVSKDKLVPILLGSSHDLQVGQRVFAIGDPFGLDHTLTTGIISGLGREVATDRGHPLKGLIQTDAAINPGNSGGPLLDSAGRLIGVNCAILSPSGASAGIGFAIPVDDVRFAVTSLINREGPQKTPPSLGVDLVPDHLTRQLGVVDGLLFYRIDPDGPAAGLGLVPTGVNRVGDPVVGDIIIGIDKKRVRTKQDVMRILQDHRPGDTITLNVRRDGQRVDVNLTLGEERPPAQ
jgi:S1-C subfamily serine protease